MATDFFSWTTIVSSADLPVDSRDWVSYELPDTVSKAMGRDPLYTATRHDQLHFWLGKLIQPAGASALSFLVRGDPPRDDTAAPGTTLEGFVVSALLPEDIPAALSEIDEIVGDAERLSRAMDIAPIGDDELADWRERASNGEHMGDEDVVWFLLSLRHVLQEALAHGDVVAHAHYVFY